MTERGVDTRASMGNGAAPFDLASQRGQVCSFPGRVTESPPAKIQRIRWEPGTLGKKKRSSSWLNIIWPFTAFHAYNFQASTCISQPSSFRAFPPGLKFGCSAMVVALRCIDHIDKKKCLGRPNCWFAQTFKKDCADFSTWPCHLWSHSLGFAASWWVSSIKLEPLQIRSWHTMNIWHQ